MALVITYGAYMAEVYRAGIEAVPKGQTEAARSLGMSHGQTMRFVIVPQAVRKVIPPLLNDLIALMKDTSMVSFIACSEVVLVGFDIQAKTFNSSALTLGAIFFLIVTIPLARVVDWLIARDQRKTSRGGRPAPTTEPVAAGTGLAGRRERLDRASRAEMPAADAAGPTLALEGVCKSFGELEVLRGVDLEVAKGEVVCVIGPSGSGKSTLLRCINLLEPPE